MLTSPGIVLYAALFVGLLLALDGLYRLVVDARSGPRAQINRRMGALAEDSGDPRRMLGSLLREKGGSRLGRLVPGLGDLERLVGQAGLTTPPGRLLALMLGCGVAAFALLRAGTALTAIPALALALALAVVPTIAFLTLRKARRLRQFEEQLPDALDLLVRSLRVGHPLSAALDVVATEMPDPIGTEFGLVVDEITYGQEVPAALASLTRRVDLAGPALFRGGDRDSAQLGRQSGRGARWARPGDPRPAPDVPQGAGDHRRRADVGLVPLPVPGRPDLRDAAREARLLHRGGRPPAIPADRHRDLHAARGQRLGHAPDDQLQGLAAREPPPPWTRFSAPRRC
jgi:hypothetical protein